MKYFVSMFAGGIIMLLCLSISGYDLIKPIKDDSVKITQKIHQINIDEFLLVTKRDNLYINDSGTLHYLDSLSCIRKKQVKDQYNTIKAIENRKCE